MPIRPEDFDSVPAVLGARLSLIPTEQQPLPPLPPPPPPTPRGLLLGLAGGLLVLGAALMAVIVFKPFADHTPPAMGQQQTTPAVQAGSTPAVQQPAVPAAPSQSQATPVVVPAPSEQATAPASPAAAVNRNMQPVRPAQGKAALNSQSKLDRGPAKDRPPQQPSTSLAGTKAADLSAGRELAQQVSPIVEPPAAHGNAAVTEGPPIRPSQPNTVPNNLPNGRETHTAIPAIQSPVYHGPSSGTLTWQGQVDGTALLAIENGQASFGTVSGTPFPGVLCMLQISDAKHFSVAVAPAPSNQWKKVVLNVHGKGVMNVRLSWVIP